MAGGEGRVQGLRKNGRKDEIDDPGSETEEAVQFTAAGLGEHQIKQPDRPAGSPMTPPPQELLELYEKQRSELYILRAKNKDLLEERDCFETQRGELLQELSDVKRVKNELRAAAERAEKNLEACNHENEQLNESNKDLRQKVHRFAAEVRQGKEELSELLKVNGHLRGDLNLATDSVKSREKTIEALEARMQRLVGNELRCKALEAEADKSKDDLIKAQERINGLMAQLQEMATEMHEGPVAKSVEEKTLPSLEDEMWESEGVNDEGQTEEAQQMPDWSSPEGKTQSERSIHTSKSMQTGDSSTSNVGNKVEKPESTIASTQTLEASVAQSDSSTRERDRVGPMRSVPSSERGPTVLLKPSIKFLYVSPPTPRTDSTLLDSEPSPLSLSARLNSFHGETRPSRALLSSIPERGVLDSHPFRTDSPPPPFAENTPELTKARLVGPRGSPLQMPWSPTSDTTLYDSDVSPPMEPVKVFDFWNRRRRPGLQGWSEFKPAEFRSGTEALYTLEQIVSNVVGQANSKDSTMQTGEKAADVGQTDEQSNQLTKAEVKRQVESGTKRGHYLSTAWWVLLICLGLLWWINQDDRRLWLQANDLTRKTVLALRDERWGGPSWLARTSFDVENMLNIDRTMLG